MYYNVTSLISLCLHKRAADRLDKLTVTMRLAGFGALFSYLKFQDSGESYFVVLIIPQLTKSVFVKVIVNILAAGLCCQLPWSQ